MGLVYSVGVIVTKLFDNLANLVGVFVGAGFTDYSFEPFENLGNCAYKRTEM